ncbi:MAG: hypothetical protein JNK82_37955 [Myxococcaceae bacterium]|nr:hypothetical protein [Myxococcaceae bacterium]
MRRCSLGLLLLLACTTPSEEWPLEKAGRVGGSATVTSGLGGDVWAFLYAPGEGPPGPPSIPKLATAISALRLGSGDSRFVFGSVAPNPYRLWGFLDVDSSFDPAVDVLAQAGAGDRTGTGVELNLQPGQTLEQGLELSALVLHEPPAFRLESGETDVTLDGSLQNPVVLTLVSDPVDRLDPKRTAFHLGLVDSDSDGRPDDLDGDGVPDLSLQLFLRWLPRPGEDGSGGSVIVPLLFDPSPFLSALGGQLGTELAVTRLSGTVVPLAQRLVLEPGMLPSLTPVGAPPRGSYELIALAAGGQFWRLPNDLRGALVSQSTRFHFDRTGP